MAFLSFLSICMTRNNVNTSEAVWQCLLRVLFYFTSNSVKFDVLGFKHTFLNEQKKKWRCYCQVCLFFYWGGLTAKLSMHVTNTLEIRPRNVRRFRVHIKTCLWSLWQRYKFSPKPLWWESLTKAFLLLKQVLQKQNTLEKWSCRILCPIHWLC